MSNQIEKKVIDILSTILKTDIGVDSSKINTSSWDSLKNIEIIFALEDTFGLSFSIGQIEKMISVKTITVEIEKNET
jgi:acyl carrier protein